jgi:hypothetical protein
MTDRLNIVSLQVDCLVFREMTMYTAWYGSIFRYVPGNEIDLVPVWASPVQDMVARTTPIDLFHGRGHHCIA